MTDKVTLEDALLAGGLPEGQTLPEHFLCLSCSQPRRPFELISHGGEYICSTCYLDAEREETAALEAAAREALADTWEGPEGDAVRAQRNVLLDRYAWTVSPASPLSAACQAAFATALQQLHRLTIDFAQPSLVVWPAIPSLEYPEGE